MDFNKLKLGKGGLFGVCDGLSNFTGIPVLLLRIVALCLLANGLGILYFYAWILLFVSGISTSDTLKKRKSSIDIKIGNFDTKNKKKKDKWDNFEKKIEEVFDNNFESKSKKKKKKKKDMSFEKFKKKHSMN
jgi:phage shock protein PspC (stress-responsive transcriptional regulator)